MTRIQAIITTAFLAISTQAFAADISGNYDPKPGQWSTVVAIFDHNENHYLLKTSLTDNLEECMTQLNKVSADVQQANGMIWTNRQKTAVTGEATPGLTDIQAKVLEIRCVLEPTKPELLKRY